MAKSVCLGFLLGINGLALHRLAVCIGATVTSVSLMVEHGHGRRLRLCWIYAYTTFWVGRKTGYLFAGLGILTKR
jgi:hypothetical protein